MATKTRLQIDAGTYFSKTVIVTDSSNANSALNLSGYTAACSFRKHWSSNVVYSVPATITNEGAGEITLVANTVTTGTYEPGRYSYDLQIVDGTGEATKVLTGILTVTPEHI